MEHIDIGLFIGVCTGVLGTLFGVIASIRAARARKTITLLRQREEVFEDEIAALEKGETDLAREVMVLTKKLDASGLGTEDLARENSALKAEVAAFRREKARMRKQLDTMLKQLAAKDSQSGLHQYTLDLPLE